MLYPENCKEPHGVGAGPVPARCPARALSADETAANVVRLARGGCGPVGPSGWHRACPYTVGKLSDYGNNILNTLLFYIIFENDAFFSFFSIINHFLK